jgi:hypothetical protein
MVDAELLKTATPNAAINILEAGRRLRSGAPSKTIHGWKGALVTAESHGPGSASNRAATALGDKTRFISDCVGLNSFGLLSRSGDGAWTLQ